MDYGGPTTNRGELILEALLWMGSEKQGGEEAATMSSEAMSKCCKE